jgi:hypothetical protein
MPELRCHQTHLVRRPNSFSQVAFLDPKTNPILSHLQIYSSSNEKGNDDASTKPKISHVYIENVQAISIILTTKLLFTNYLSSSLIS